MKRITLWIIAGLLAISLAWIGVSFATAEIDESKFVDMNLDLSELPRGAPSSAELRESEVLASTSPQIQPTTDDLIPKEVMPLAPHTEKGLAYLANQQLENGGWGQGGGWRTNDQTRIQPEDQRYRETADVGNTAIATLALIRGGSSPESGPFATEVRAGLDFVIASIETADHESLFITDVRGTQLQSKIGVYVDTFLANLLLAEVRGRMSDGDSEVRLEAALAKVLSKIERHQLDDGTFAENRGWASVLSTSLANKALNRSKQVGATVADEALEKVERQANDSFDESTGEFTGGESYGSTAGVELYKAGAGLAALDDLDKTGRQEENEMREILSSEASEEAKQAAASKLERLTQTRKKKREAVGSMTRKLTDTAFVAGFGSSGGEEYLSYMNISEALAADGGEEWDDWNRRVSASLAEAQNGDGSWSGHHCITGRIFVTSSALLTLMADRAPRPFAAQVRG